MLSESHSSMSNQERSLLLKALRESELLRELTELLASSLDPTHILQVLVRRTTEACDVERCAVWLLDEAQGRFLPSAYHVSSASHLQQKIVQATDHMWRRSSLPFNDSIFHRMLHERGMLALEDLRTEPSMRTLAEKFRVRSVLLVALVREDRPVGIMSLDNPGQITVFSEEQQQLARAIGQQAAVAIDNAHLYQQAQAERRRAERLIERAQSTYQVAMAVNAGEDLLTVLDIAAQHLMRGLEAHDVAIALLEGDRLSLATTTRQHANGAKISMTPDLMTLPHCCTIAETATPHFVQKEQFEGIEKHWFHQLGFENVMIVPLMVVGTHSKSGEETRENAPSETHHCAGFTFINYARSMRQPTPGQYAFAQDITTQCALAVEKMHILNEARQALALATERANTLDAVFNAMSEGIIVLDMEGRIIISNDTAARFMGISRDAENYLMGYLQQHPTYTLYGQPIPEDDFPLARALQGEYVRGERFISQRSDGAERSLEVNIVPLLDSANRKIGIVGAFRYITEQVRAERRIRRALDTMLHAAEAVSGLTDMKEMLHRVLAMTMTALNCERGVVQLYDEGKQTFKPLLSIGFAPEEEQQWLEEQKHWLTAKEGHNEGLLAQLQQGHATLISAEHAETLRQTMILMAPITHDKCLLGVMMLDRSITLKKENRQPVPTGSTRPLPRPPFNVWDMAVVEGIAQFAGLAIEQTRWQEEAKIARTNEAIMREANALKDEFLAITAHEFRTPLTVVLAHSQMMARLLRRTEDIPPTVQSRLNESISFIEVQAHQLTNIVNTFLEVTRLNRGQIALDMEEIDLEDVVKEAIANHSATSTIHQLRYKIKPSSHPYLLIGDKARLLQIFANLLQNAIKYSPAGGPVTITLAQCENEEGKKIIKASVEDKGIGIPKDAQPHLFERFYRAPNSEGKARGVGLGLYVVAQFLRLHGGTISVESSGVEGDGSRFTCTLPLLEKYH